LRLALIGPVHPIRGGVSQFTTRLAEELLLLRDDVLVVSWRRQYPARLYPGREQLVEPIGEQHEQGARFMLDYRDPFTVVRAFRTIRRWRPGAIAITWTTTFTAPYYLLLLWLIRRALPGVPVIAICHNVLPHEQRPLDRGLTRAVLGRVDAAVVHAGEQLAELRAVAPRTAGRHLTMPEFGPRATTDPARTDDGDAEPSRRRTILFFGYVRPYKGLDRLLQAMALLDPRLDVHLVVAGEFWEPRERYDRIAAELRIADRVEIVDRYLDEAEVAERFAAADVVVLPYVSATQSAVVQLAFAHGRPVISTTVGGIPEVVDEGVNGLLVEPDDPPALAAAITRFYTEALGAQMRARIAARDTGGWRRYVDGLRTLSSAPNGAEEAAEVLAVDVAEEHEQGEDRRAGDRVAGE
jgi:D-inositol-3-phosphate glycosyltransferase